HPPPAARTRFPTRRAAELAGSPAGPAAARTADAGRRTPAPSPTPPPPPGPAASPLPPPPRTPAAPTCPPPPHPAPPAPARAQTADPPRAHQAPRALAVGPTRPALAQTASACPSPPEIQRQPTGAAKSAGLCHPPDVSIQETGKPQRDGTATAVSSRLIGPSGLSRRMISALATQGHIVIARWAMSRSVRRECRVACCCAWDESPNRRPHHRRDRGGGRGGAADHLPVVTNHGRGGRARDLAAHLIATGQAGGGPA